MSLPAAKRVIHPDRALALARSLKLARDDWNEAYGMQQYILSKNRAARPLILGLHFYHHAEQQLGGMPGIHFGSDQQQTYIAFDGRIALRIKQLTRNLQTVNYPTEHAKDWVSQIPLKIPLAGDMAPPVRLEFGYRTDLTGTAIKDAFIMLPNGIANSVNDWVWQIWGEPANDVFGVQSAFRQRATPLEEIRFHEDLSAFV